MVVRLPLGRVRDFGITILALAGTPPDDARLVVDHLVQADRMGLRSHGMARVVQYLDAIDTGELDPTARPEIVQSETSRAVIDGHGGFGQVVAGFMVDEVTRLARRTGAAFVAGHRMGHTGRIGAYPERLAEAGLVGIAFSSGPPSGQWVAPFGGIDGRLTTNPIAYAYPVNGAAPVVADFSTSMVPEGIVRGWRNRGVPAPAGTLLDSDGRATTDPSVLYGHPPGAILPMGGPVGYRGTALGILVEVLTTLAAGDSSTDVSRRGSNLSLIAITTIAGFPQQATVMGSYIRSSRPIDPSRPVMLPGDRELAKVNDFPESMFEFDEPTWVALTDAARRLGAAVPAAE